MKKTAIAAGAAFLLASTAAALADETGTITDIEWAIGVITLDNGHMYVVPESVQSTHSMGVGDKVTLETEGMRVTSISSAT